MRLLLIQRGAADFLRHCSLLHGYCTHPPGTSPLSLPLFLSLSASVYPLRGHSLSLSPSLFSLLPPFFLFFLYLTWSKFCLPALTPSLPQFTVYCGSTAPPCGSTGTSQVTSKTSRAVQSALSESLLGHVPELADVGLFLFKSQLTRQSVCFN